jgi:hypothetical protein
MDFSSLYGTIAQEWMVNPFFEWARLGLAAEL